MMHVLETLIYNQPMLIFHPLFRHLIVKVLRKQTSFLTEEKGIRETRKDKTHREAAATHSPVADHIKRKEQTLETAKAELTWLNSKANAN